MKNSQFVKSSRSLIETRIDVVEECGSVLLKQSVWTESIGWLSQKTLRLDLKAVRDLKSALEKAEKELSENGNNVINFPSR